MHEATLQEAMILYTSIHWNPVCRIVVFPFQHLRKCRISSRIVRIVDRHASCKPSRPPSKSSSRHDYMVTHRQYCHILSSLMTETKRNIRQSSVVKINKLCRPNSIHRRHYKLCAAMFFDEVSHSFLKIHFGTNTVTFLHRPRFEKVSASDVHSNSQKVCCP